MLRRQSNNLINAVASRNIFQLVWGSWLAFSIHSVQVLGCWTHIKVTPTFFVANKQSVCFVKEISWFSFRFLTDWSSTQDYSWRIRWESVSSQHMVAKNLVVGIMICTWAFGMISMLLLLVNCTLLNFISMFLLNGAFWLTNWFIDLIVEKAQWYYVII